MEDLIKIRDICQQFDLTTRTLRYYEQIGLLRSVRSDNYAYRLYDADTIQRLKQIIVLKKMQIPLKDIKKVLLDNDASTTINVFVKKLEELDIEISALADLRKVVTVFLNHLKKHSTSSRTLDLLYEKITDQAAKTALTAQEKENITMEYLNSTEKQLNQLKDVRIVRLPPMRIAWYRAHSATPEKDAWDVMMPFYQQNLKNVPGVRSFGFNNPCPDGKNPEYGYEVWFSVPKDITIPAPLQEKQFSGGLYAVYVCTLNNISDIWKGLTEWAQNSDEFELEHSGIYTTHPGLEETLDIEGNFDENTFQLDIFVPIKPRK